MSDLTHHRATLEQLRADYAARAARPGTSDGARRVALAAAEAIGALVGRVEELEEANNQLGEAHNELLKERRDTWESGYRAHAANRGKRPEDHRRNPYRDDAPLADVVPFGSRKDAK